MLEPEFGDAGTTNHGCYNQQLPIVEMGGLRCCNRKFFLLEPEFGDVGTRGHACYNQQLPAAKTEGSGAATRYLFCWNRAGEKLQPLSAGAGTRLNRDHFCSTRKIFCCGDR